MKEGKAEGKHWVREGTKAEAGGEGRQRERNTTKELVRKIQTRKIEKKCYSKRIQLLAFQI